MNESGLTREEIKRKSHKSSAERASRFYYFPLSINLTVLHHMFFFHWP